MHRVSYGYRSSYSTRYSGRSSYTVRRPALSGYTHHRVRRRETHSLPVTGCGSYRDTSRGVNYHIYDRSNRNNNTCNVGENGADYKPANTPTRKPDFSNVLTVQDVDLNIRENVRAHHTDEYDVSSYRVQASPKLVVRRGQPFTVEIDFSKEFDTEKDDLKLVFECGDEPNSCDGTYVEIVLSDEDLPDEWGAKIVGRQGTRLSVQIFTPSTLYVGKWDFSVEVVKADDVDTDIYQYEHDDPIYILFNPWNKNDTVYLDDEALLEEYVLNETGYVYVGSQNSISEKPWNFGQFDSVILDCALSLLDDSDLKWVVRGDPVKVIRKISALINTQDDNGVLVGKWDGDYAGGHSPCSWSGSVKILEKYYKNKIPVKFGQCWVFSGVSTTICRALGIPARSVTNFQSAHDTDGSVTIDDILDSSGNPVERLKEDSVWNFHVWNEAWMARPDLPKGYGGWQAFDATPQETSEGVYCCGPTSVEAVKQGNVHLPFDASFLFAEVNADRWTWQPNLRGKLECIHQNRHAIGKHISTKAPNSARREDLTLQYKHQEGTREEREAVIRANQVGSTRPDLYKNNKNNNQDVKFSIEQDSTNTWIGGDFEVTMRVTNSGATARSLSGRIVVNSQYYTGQLADVLKTHPISGVSLRPGQETAIKVRVKYEEYDGKLKDCCMLSVSVFGQVAETGQKLTARESYRLRKPHLTLKAPRQAEIGTEFIVEASFTNPLTTVLTGCYIEVEGLSSPLKFRLRSVTPKGTLMSSLPITPKKVGKKNLIVIFNSDQLEDINACVPIYIEDK